MIHRDFYCFGCSIDGVLPGTNIIIEIKNVTESWLLTISDALKAKKVNCLKEFKSRNASKWKLKDNHDFYYEIQMKLEISNAEECIFLLQTKQDYFIDNIQRDKSWWLRESTKLIKFWQYFTLEYLDPRKERNLKTRTHEESKTFCEGQTWIMNFDKP